MLCQYFQAIVAQLSTSVTDLRSDGKREVFSTSLSFSMSISLNDLLLFPGRVSLVSRNLVDKGSLSDDWPMSSLVLQCFSLSTSDSDTNIRSIVLKDLCAFHDIVSRGSARSNRGIWLGPTIRLSCGCFIRNSTLVPPRKPLDTCVLIYWCEWGRGGGNCKSVPKSFPSSFCSDKYNLDFDRRY